MPFCRRAKKLGRKSPQEKINAPPYRYIYIYINNNKKVYIVDAKRATLALMRVAGCLLAVALLYRHGHLEEVQKNNTIILVPVNND